MKRCIVCDCKDQKASFHKFPSNPYWRQKWLNQCNIRGKIPNYLYICSSHFKKEDYINTRLRRDALPKLVEQPIEIQYVPTQRKKNEILSCSESSTPYVKNSSRKKNTSTQPLSSVNDYGGNKILSGNGMPTSKDSLINTPHCATSSRKKKTSTRSLSSVNDHCDYTLLSGNGMPTSKDSLINTPRCATSTKKKNSTRPLSSVNDHCDYTILSGNGMQTSKDSLINTPLCATSTKKKNSTRPLSSVNDHSENTILSGNSMLTSKDSLINTPLCATSLIWIPSNIASLNNGNFSTPMTANSNLNLIKKKLVDKDKKIKCLTERNRRLLKKVKNLKNKVDVLEKKDILSEEASQIFKSCQSPVLKDIIIKNKKGTFTPELRQFAVTLQFYSARAYNFVRKTFNNVLPHPKSVSRWYRVDNGKLELLGTSLEDVNEEIANKEVANEEVSYEEVVNEKTANEEVANEKTANEEVANKEVANKEVANEEVSYEEVVNEKTANEEVSYEEVANEKTANEEVANEEVSYEEVTNEKAANEEVSYEEVANEKAAYEEVVYEEVANEKVAIYLTVDEKATEKSN